MSRTIRTFGKDFKVKVVLEAPASSSASGDHRTASYILPIAWGFLVFENFAMTKKPRKSSNVFLSKYPRYKRYILSFYVSSYSLQSSTRIMDKRAPVGLHLQFDLDHRCGHGLQNRAIEPLTYPHHLDYYFSSARNYAGLENDLDVVVLDLF